MLRVALGIVFHPGVPCTSSDVTRYLAAHADDAETAWHSIAQRPDADMGRVLAVKGPAERAAVKALAARKAAPFEPMLTRLSAADRSGMRSSCNRRPRKPWS